MKTIRKYLNGLTEMMFPMDVSCISCFRDLELNTRVLCRQCETQIIAVEDPICEICGHPIDQYRVGSLCKNCISEKYTFLKVRSCFEYSDALKSLIHRMKYDDQTYLTRYFAEDMARKYESLNFEVDAVLSVPSYASKTFDQGYHVAELLTRFFCEKTQVENISHLIQKTKQTPSQVSLSGVERRNNLTNAFATVEDLSAYGSILIIDDIFTTGSTMNEVAKAVKRAGVKDIVGLTLATSKRE